MRRSFRDACRISAVVVGLTLGTSPSGAQEVAIGGGAILVPVDDASREIDAIHSRVVATARALGLAVVRPDPDEPSALDRNTLATLNFPLRLRTAGRGASGS